MPALAGEPWRGLAKVRLADALGSDTAVVGLSAQLRTSDEQDRDEWEGEPGQQLTLRALWVRSGSPGWDSPTAFLVEARVPDGARVGTAWGPPLVSGTVATRTFHFDDGPLDEILGALRAGTLELYVRMERTSAVTWGYVDSRGGVGANGVPVGATHSWGRGYVRARSRLSSFAISNVALGGAEPAKFAYPDTTFNRAVVGAQWYRSLAFAVAHVDPASGASIRSQTLPASAGVTRDATWSANSGLTARVNNDYPNGPADVRLALPDRDYGGDNELAWLPESVTNRIPNPSAEVDTVGWSPVGAGVTLERLVSGALYGSAVFRVTTQGTGTGMITDLLPAEPSEPYIASAHLKWGIGNTQRISLSFYDASQALISNATVNRDSSVGAWQRLIVAATSPANAAYLKVFCGSGAGVTGISLDIDGVLTLSEGYLTDYFDGDVGGGSWNGTPHNSTSTKDLGQPAGWSLENLGSGGYVNSFLIRTGRFTADPALSFERHLQVNDNTFALALGIATGQRLTADLGFVAARVLNARGEGVNLSGDKTTGGAVRYSLRDDGALVAALTAADHATTTKDGQPGWGSLLAWDSQLPGGGWTLTATVEDADGVQGTGSLAFTLLASDPRIVVVCGGGSGTDGASHWKPGDVLLAGLSPMRINGEGRLLDAVEDGLAQPEVALTRLNTATNTAQHFDGAAWVDTGAGPITWFPCLSPQALGLSGETRAYVRTFGPGGLTDVDTSDWGTDDIFVLARVLVRSTPYGNYQQAGVAGPWHKHSKNLSWLGIPS